MVNKEGLIREEMKKREEIINIFDKNYILEAGAGAGKTTIIVQRMINHIITSTTKTGRQSRSKLTHTQNSNRFLYRIFGLLSTSDICPSSLTRKFMLAGSIIKTVITHNPIKIFTERTYENMFLSADERATPILHNAISTSAIISDGERLTETGSIRMSS